MKRLAWIGADKARARQATALPGLLALCLLAAPLAHADQTINSPNNNGAGTLSAAAQLNFNIAIAKYVLLRVGNADASVAAVTFAVGPSPVLPSGNSRAYSGAIPPAMATTVASTNPTGSGALTVAAYTNVAGTTLTCSLSPLAGASAFATGATAGGIPGTNDITVQSGATGTVQHPGTSLAACNGSTTSAITNLTAMTGSFTYAATFSPASLAAGTYGNTVTYTATTP